MCFTEIHQHAEKMLSAPPKAKSHDFLGCHSNRRLCKNVVLSFRGAIPHQNGAKTRRCQRIPKNLQFVFLQKWGGVQHLFGTFLKINQSVSVTITITFTVTITITITFTTTLKVCHVSVKTSTITITITITITTTLKACHVFVKTSTIEAQYL